MYPNFNAERARAGLTLEDIANASNETVGSVSNRLCGRAPITLAKAREYQKIIGTTVTIDELFKTRAEIEAEKLKEVN